MLPILDLLGPEFDHLQIVSAFFNRDVGLDSYSRLLFSYKGSLGSATVAKGAKSEGELLVAGTQGYAFVPAPWWKTDYFELRYENQENNKRFFYQLDGEGIRNELVAFAKAVEGDRSGLMVSKGVSLAIARVIAQFETGVGVRELQQ